MGLLSPTLTGVLVLVRGGDSYHPASRAGALSANMVAQSSVLAGAVLLTLRAMLARRTAVFTAGGSRKKEKEGGLIKVFY